MDEREAAIREDERQKMIGKATAIMEQGTDRLIREIGELVEPLEGELARAKKALAMIAGGVPVEDEWRSAASFMEHVAAILESHGFRHLRPDHYENEDDYR